MTQTIFIYFLVANICALKKLELANDCRGNEKSTQESASDTSDSYDKIKYPRNRRNNMILRSNESLTGPSNNTIKPCVNNSNTANAHTHINKSTIPKPISPKINHIRTSEGI